MRADELRRVIGEPAGRAGLVVEPELLEAALDEVTGQPGALPMLSAALVRAWENRSGNVLTLDGYRRGGGVAGAVQAAAEDVYTALSPAGQLVARQLLVRLAVLEGGVWVRRPLPLSDVDGTWSAGTGSARRGPPGQPSPSIGWTSPTRRCWTDGRGCGPG